MNREVICRVWQSLDKIYDRQSQCLLMTNYYTEQLHLIKKLVKTVPKKRKFWWDRVQKSDTAVYDFCTCTCTAKTKCRKFETNTVFPEKEYRGLSPNFHIHVSVSKLYIPTMGLPFLLEEICGLILGTYKSLTDTWMWKLGLRPRNSQKRNI